MSHKTKEEAKLTIKGTDAVSAAKKFFKHMGGWWFVATNQKGKTMIGLPLIILIVITILSPLFVIILLVAFLLARWNISITKRTKEKDESNQPTLLDTTESSEKSESAGGSDETVKETQED